MSEERGLAIVKSAPDAGIVRLGGNVVEALREYQGVQAALDKAMPDCIMKIQGRPFRKKQYWRAIATAFNLRLECIREERHGADFLQNDAGYTVTYRATAPNGRFADGDGACFSSEKKALIQKTEHNVRSHAHTRAFNRAVSNLVGFGEVSAEEVEREDQPEEPGTHDGQPPEETHQAKGQAISEAQRRRLYAISKTMQARHGKTEEQRDKIVKAVIEKHGFKSSTEITSEKYEPICEEVANHE